ncbi:MAG: ribosome biogenesis GTPase Der, partial [Candidatus Neomarinimicrobiota bacterium]
MRKSVVAIVGRPNVGKSTLFNRLIGRQHAIVHEQEGVTRDRIYGEVEWAGRMFTLIDTGGYLPEKVDVMEEAVRRQVEFAIDEAEVLLFIVDGREGVSPVDKSLAGILRESGKKHITAVNKIDNDKQEVLRHEFSSLGLDPITTISALGGRKIGDLLDMIVGSMGAPMKPREKETEKEIRIAIVGMPNVGKSSIANALLGYEKYIVTEIPGTTRDSADSRLRYHNQTYVLVDTAGLRKKARVKENLEYYSALRSHRAVDDSEVVLVILDAPKGFGRQDQQIVREVIEKGKGLILLVNKWDLVQKETNTYMEYAKSVNRLFKATEDYPILFVSAMTKQRISKILPECKNVFDRCHQWVSTGKLNGIVKEATDRYQPPAERGKNIRIKYTTQTGEAPPRFSFFCNFPQLFSASYRNYLENQLRSQIDMKGTPIRLVFK